MQKHLNFAKGLLIGFMLYSSVTQANCPAMNKVVYKCVNIGNKQHCNWMAPWWDGYHGSADTKPGEHPVKFIEVFWGASAAPEVGSTNCFYQDHEGGWVELSQNSWGGVAKPTSDNWTPGEWPENLKISGLICNQGIADCQFAYG